MELIKIEGLFTMDTGCPSPGIIANDHELFVTFYNNSDDDELIYVLSFKHCIKHVFGGPNDEALSGHPYYEIGLGSYGFYELIDSDWIAGIKEMNSVHPLHNPRRYDSFKHYILTFHDNMFECVAEAFNVKLINRSIVEDAAASFIKHFVD